MRTVLPFRFASRRRRLGPALALVLVLAGAGGVLASNEDEQQRALLELIVNGVARGQVLAIVRASDVLVPLEAVERAGVGNLGGKRETLDDQSWVSLKSLAPGIAYEFDERGLVLRITARPEHLVRVTRLDFRDADRPAFEFKQSTSGFVNYGLAWRDNLGFSATAEGGFSLRGSLASTTITWSEGHSAVRGLSSVTFDRRSGLQRIVAGDSYVADTTLGGNAFLGGVRVASEYSLDPYFVRYPTLGLSGMVTTASRVDVYVDNRLVKTEHVDPGRFDLANLAVPIGTSQTRVVIRDALGREQEIARPYYLSRTTLAKGLHEYEYAAGAIREEVGIENWNYGGPAVFARHRYGVSDRVTAGMRLEAKRGLVSAGPSLNLTLPLGGVELTAAASRSEERTGSAGQAAYLYSARAISAGLSWRHFSRYYRTLAPSRGQDDTRAEVNAFAGTAVGPLGTVTLQYGRVRSHGGATQNRYFVFGTARVWRRASAYLSAGRSTGTAGRGREFSVGLNLALADRVSAVAGVVGTTTSTAPTMELQRGLPVGAGYGYRLAAAGGSTDTARARLEYQSAFGRYQLERESLPGADATSASLAGGLVALGGRVYASRPVDQSFALLRVPGVPGVRGYLSNQEVGRTDERGDLLIPNLLPYYGNRVGVNDGDVPLDRTLDATERRIAPPFRGGALVLFDALPVRSVSGRVQVERQGMLLVPEFGELFVESQGRRVESPIGREGDYYLEGLTPGRYEAWVQYLGSSCSFTLTVPANDEAVTDVGLSRCVAKR